MAEAAELARRIAVLAAEDRSIATRANRLAERIARQRFHIAIAGEFKRGKSTLVNALLGRPVLPTGVVPLTTVATEVHFGEPVAASVVYEDGRREHVADTELADYVTEVGNPGNRRGVRRVELSVDASTGGGWAEPALVLVDTPGFASVHEHQTAAATAALDEADAAVVVLSVDSPLSEGERSLLAELADRRGTLFLVVNKCDHLTLSELEDVRAYLDDQLRGLAGERARTFYVAARRVLEGDGAATTPEAALHDGDDGGFAAFRRALGLFVRRDLADARAAAAFSELARLAQSLEAMASIEAAAATLDHEQLEQVLQLCREAVEDGRRRFAEERLVLGHEVEELSDQVGRLLFEGVASVSSSASEAVAAAGTSASRRQLVGQLDDAVGDIVERAMEPLRRTAQEFVEQGWAELAARFEGKFWDRTRALQARTGELLHVALVSAPVPLVRSEPDRFTYSFLRVESPGTAAAHLAQAFLPVPGVRHRMVRRAQDQVRRDLDKHAGRARYDLVQRLHGAERRFVTAMSAEMDETETSILEAIQRARALINEGQAGRDSAERARDDASEIARQISTLAGKVSPRPRPEGAERAASEGAPG